MLSFIKTMWWIGSLITRLKHHLPCLNNFLFQPKVFLSTFELIFWPTRLQYVFTVICGKFLINISAEFLETIAFKHSVDVGTPWLWITEYVENLFRKFSQPFNCPYVTDKCGRPLTRNISVWSFFGVFLHLIGANFSGWIEFFFCV